MVTEGHDGRSVSGHACEQGGQGGEAVWERGDEGRGLAVNSLGACVSGWHGVGRWYGVVVF